MSAQPGTLPLPSRRRKPRESTRKWRKGDRIGLVLCWTAGLALCLVAGGIVIYMMVQGLKYLTPHLLFTHPQPDLDQSKTGGFLDPLLGTLILTIAGIVLAVPLGVAIAVWLTEYGRPAGLARAVESGVEVVAGTPSIVLAIF